MTNDTHKTLNEIVEKKDCFAVWNEWVALVSTSDYSLFDEEVNLKLDQIICENFEEVQYSEEGFQLESPYFDPEKQVEMDWKERTGLTDDTLKGAIETIIFMSDRPIPLIKIRDYIDKEIPVRTVHDALTDLQSEYEAKHHGIRLLEVAEGFQFRTKATYSRYVQNYFKISSLVLTPSALEVLAIIAYKQPVSRVEIDKIRGVDSSHIVRTLMDKRLVKISGRSEELGRPTLYGTTPEFLEVFNLADISELPSEHELEEISKKQSVGAISDIKNLVATGDKAKFFYDELDELDKLSEQIKEIRPNTLFTKSLNVEEKKRVSEEGNKVKSAFEILEEFVSKKEVLDQNQLSGISELVNEAVFPQVINDLLVQDLNAPEEEEEFEMIDLETGEPIRPEEQETEDEFLFTDNEIETLEKKLDEVFDRLEKGDILKQLSFEEEESFLHGNELDDKGEKIDVVTENMIEKAEEFDLDLGFLAENAEKNSNQVDLIDSEML